MQATSYIITYRATDDPTRRANLEAVLAWLRLQTLAEVIVVEQDAAPTLGDLGAFPGLRSLFAYNPGPFNKSWGFNVGVRASTGFRAFLWRFRRALPWIAGRGRRRALRRAGGPWRFRGPSISTRPTRTCCGPTFPALATPASP